MSSRPPEARKPTKILVDVDTRQVQINWADAHTSVYDMTDLRRACPCIQCQPWKEGLGPVGVTPEAVQRAEGALDSPEDISLVGGYAISFRWADGHTFGIYDFEYLRDLCPCPICTELLGQRSIRT